MLIVMTAANALRSHRNWSGGISDLVAEAARVQNGLGLGDGGGLNLRLARHYIAKGCISGAAGRDGTRAVYGYRHVIEAVASRLLLADGWNLDKVREALGQLKDPEIERLILERSTVHGQAAASAAPAPGPSATQAALGLIAGFRRPPGLRQQAAARPDARQAARQAGAGPRALVRHVTEHAPAAWLRISVDEQALARAAPGEAVRALNEAAAILESLKP